MRNERELFETVYHVWKGIYKTSTMSPADFSLIIAVWIRDYMSWQKVEHDTPLLVDFQDIFMSLNYMNYSSRHFES